MASSNYRGNSGQADPLASLIPFLIGILLIFACFGMLVGALLARIIGRRPWSLYAWVALGVLGAIATLYVYYDADLVHVLMLQVRTAYATLSHLHFNVTLLWSVTWPVWLRTLCIAPFVGIVLTLFRPSSPENQLLAPVRQLQARLSRSSRRAGRKTRRPEKVPDQVDGQAVLGVPIDEEA
jgi:MFS family permease